MRRWEAVPFVVCLLVSLLAFLTPAPDLPSGPPVSDKVEHALIFAVLALTGGFARLRLRRLAIGLASYAVITEVLQATLPIHRDGDWHDLVADGTGLLVGLVVWRIRVRYPRLRIRTAARAGTPRPRRDG